MRFKRQYPICLLLSVGLVSAAFAANQATVYDTVANNGTVSITTKNSDGSNATWTLWGDVDYSKANGGGTNTAYTFSTTTNCLC